MPITLPISRLVNVNVTLTAQAAQAQALNNALILDSSGVIDVVTRMRTYTTLTQVANDFGTSAPAYLAAVLWFQQAPQPTSLLIGQWAKTATSGQWFGGPLTIAQQAIALWNAVTTPSFYVFLNGVPTAIAPASLATAATLPAVAAIIQTALNSAVAGTTCTWDSIRNRFIVTTAGSTGVTSTVSLLGLPTAVGSAVFSGQPANLDTITLNGTTVTFVTGTPVGNQVQIGSSLAVTLANFLSFAQASADTQLVKFKYTFVSSTLYFSAATPGSGGNSLTIAKSSTAITLSGSTLAGGSGTDISVMLSGTSGAYVAPGIAAESALTAVTLFDTTFGQQWYGLVVLGAADSDHTAIAGYVEGTTTKHFYGVTTQEANVLVAGDITTIAYSLQQLAYNHTAVQYSSTNPYAVVSLLARILTTDWDANSSAITLMYKQEPGIVAENLTTTQITALEAKNCNVFVAYNNNTAIIEQGVSSSGQFIDTVIGIDALSVDLQTDLYNALFLSTTKIPQTDAGTHILTTIISNRCALYQADGLLAPGVWTGPAFGSLNTGDTMSKGFYVYAAPLATQSAAARASRVSVPISIACKLAGAVHTVSCLITVVS